MGKKSRNIFKRLNFDWFRKLGRNTKLALILGAVLVVVGIFSIIFTRSNEPEVVTNEEPEQVTEIETANLMNVSIVLIEGTLEYRTAEQGWELATEELEIVPGTSLRTIGAVSRAVIGLEDGSEVRLDANSQLEITTMTTNRVIIAHEDGYVFSRIIASDTRDYVVETENAQFEAVGTAFRTISTGDEEGAEAFESSVDEVVTNQTIDSGEKLIIEEDNQEVTSTVGRLDINTLKEDPFIQWNKERDQDSELFRNDLGFLSDFDGPDIEITNPKPSSTVTIEADADPLVKISGKTEAGTTLTVQTKSVSGSNPKDVSVSGDGKFTTPELKAVIGNSVFEFIATDRRGNETKLNVNYTFARKVSTVEQGIALTVTETADSVDLAWGLVGLTAPDGLRVVYGETENPSLGDADVTSISVSSGSTSAVVTKADLNKDTTYYFRVCRYTAGTDSCDVYSNQVSVVIPPDTP